MSTTYPVKPIQRRLNELGYVGANGRPLVEDGLFGANTSFAVIAFKKAIGLRPRDFVGEITWRALFDTASPATPEQAPAPWFAELSRLMGLHEERDRTLLERTWASTIGKLNPDATAWCGALEAHIMRATLPGVKIPESYLSARSWKDFGVKCAPQLGAVMVFWRGSPTGWQGHVANYVSESASAYKVRGGNQSDRVSDTWIEKRRLIDARWPSGFPMTGKEIIETKTGVVSVNEA